MSLLARSLSGMSLLARSLSGMSLLSASLPDASMTGATGIEQVQVGMQSSVCLSAQYDVL